MTITEHEITAGDTRTPIGVVLKQPNASGIDTAVDLTGLTVQFKMVHNDGTVVVAESATGVTVVDATAGKVQKILQSGDVTAINNKMGSDLEVDFYGWFTAYDGSDRDAFPVGRRFRIRVHKFG